MNGSWDAYLASSADFAGRMTSSPTWQRRESLGSRSLNALPNVIITSLYVDYIHHLQELFPQNQMIIAEHSDNGIQRDGQKVAAAA